MKNGSLFRLSVCWTACLFLSILLLTAGCGGSNDTETNLGADSSASLPKGEPFEATFNILNAPDSMGRIIGTIGSTNFLVDSIKPINGVYYIKLDTALLLRARARARRRGFHRRAQRDQQEERLAVHRARILARGSAACPAAPRVRG